MIQLAKIQCLPQVSLCPCYSLTFVMAETAIDEDDLNFRELVYRKLYSVQELLTQQTNDLDIPDVLETIEMLMECVC